MATLYLVSVEGEVGKTALALGLALQAKARGLSVGYFKPVGIRVATQSGRLIESDAEFARKTLGLEDSAEVLSPVLLTEVIRREAIEGRALDAPAAVKTAFAQLSRGKDLMIVEGPPTTRQGITLGVEPAKVAEMIDAKVVVVLRGEYQLSAEAALLAQSIFGDRLIGAIVNAAPLDTTEDARANFGPYLERHNLKLFGVLRRDPVLGAFTVGELVSILGGRLVAGEPNSEALVESFVVGAMGTESALRHFLQHANKAVITGGDRSDIILAAIDTPTRLIILTGNLSPDVAALARAAERHVPVLVVPTDTIETVRIIEEAKGPIRLSSKQQLDRLGQLMSTEINFDALLGAIGVEAKR